MTKKVIMTMGLPASGKTSWAKDIQYKYPGIFKRINKDDLRSMLDRSKWSHKNEKFVLELRDYILKESLRNGWSVILDDTNLNPIHKDNIEKLINDYNLSNNDNVTFETKFFNTHVDECIIRDKQRPNGVGEKVINNMYNQYRNLYNFDNVDPIIQNTNLPKTIIVDIDGTVTKMAGRGAFEWDKVIQDEPKKEIIDIVKLLKENGYMILFLSGRDDSCYDDTMSWIKKHIFDENDITLLMRRTGDNRSDDIVKKEIFFDKIYNKYYITHIFDDRNKVVRAWRELGLTCLQVAPGNF